MIAWLGNTANKFHLWHRHNHPIGVALLSRLEGGGGGGGGATVPVGGWGMGMGVGVVMGGGNDGRSFIS